MHRFGLVLALVITLMRSGQPSESMNGSGTAKYVSPGPVCSIDPTWGIALPNRVLDPGGSVRVPRDLDPVFEWSAPCFRHEQPPEAGHDQSLPSQQA